jgi:hypothetical protein
MTFSEIRLFQTQVQDTDTTVFTAIKKTVLRDLLAVNIDGSLQWFSMHLVPDDETLGDEHLIISVEKLKSNQNYHFSGWIVIYPDDELSLIGQANDKINIVASGAEVD